MTYRILLSPPDVGPLEKSFLMEAIDSGWVAPVGPHIDAFESEMANFVGSRHAVALASGTAGLHLGLLSLRVGQGDEVVVPSLTFAATAFAVAYTGAKPVILDSERETWNLDPNLLEAFLATRARHGTLPAAVISVDIFGQPANHTDILAICARYDIPAIEDAAEALGARVGNTRAGLFGAAGVFSFNGNKIMTTGGGGMLVTNSDAIAERTRLLANQARLPTPWYEHSEIGYNYRMSNLLAALGRAQLRRLPDMIERRRSHRSRYERNLRDAGLRVKGDPPWGAGNAWLTVVEFADSSQPAVTRQHLARAGVESRHVWKPMHLQPAFSSHETHLTGAAEHIFAHGLCMPSGSALTTMDIDEITGLVHESLQTRDAGHQDRAD